MNETRHSGRRVVPIFVGAMAALLGLILTLWIVFRVPNGEVIAIAPDGEGGVVVLRRGDFGRDGVHVVRMDASGSVGWRHAVFGISSDGGDVAVVANGKLVVRALEDDGQAAVHAFALDTGEFAWRALMHTPEQGSAVPLLVPSEHSEIDALPRSIDVRYPGGTSARLSLEDGSATPLPDGVTPPCGVAREGDRFTLTGSHGSTRSVPGGRAIGSCALRRERAVFLVLAGDIIRADISSDAPVSAIAADAERVFVGAGSELGAVFRRSGDAVPGFEGALEIDLGGSAAP